MGEFVIFFFSIIKVNNVNRSKQRIPKVIKIFVAIKYRTETLQRQILKTDERSRKVLPLFMFV